MTPQQSIGSYSKVNCNESRIPEKEKKMRTALQRRHSGQSAITKAFSKPKGHSRDAVPVPSPRAALIQSLTSQSAEFVMEEHVQLSTGLQTQERHLFLFSDTLIIAKSKSSTSRKRKERVRLCEMWLASCTEEVAERKLCSKNSFVIGWPTTNYVVTLSSSESKEKWLSTLQWHITKSKEVEYLSNLTMKVLLMDIGNSAMTTVNVDNTCDVDKVIRILTQQFRLTGRPTDYRLWVVSGREEAPYPLIGHEHPFSIILNSLREMDCQASAVTNNILTVDGSLYLDHLLKDTSGPRFILRLKAEGGGHGRADSFQKHIKRKKSLLDWALRRGHGSQGGGYPESPTTPHKLFGLSLSSICHHGTLPRPIMDMLYLLYHEGPTTTGIFRRSANAKTCRELKERLNSGNSVQLEGESVFVAASVITDFLRNIPGSVLSTGLYEKWMEVMAADDIEDKIELVKGLLSQLPEDNVTLLRYLFALLYHIQESSQENQMNALNLSLCIAPNMLWLPVPTGPEEESQSNKKVAALIQLLIENTPAIFGKDVECIFTKPNCEQGTVDDVMVESYQQLYLSDDLDWEKQGGLHSPNREPLFLSPGKLVLKEKKENLGLLNEVDSLKKLHVSEESAYSCGNLDFMSSLSSGSICSLMGTQSLRSARCSSEPSVSLASPQSGSQSQIHTPVARQSSCDAAVMCGCADHSQHKHKPHAKGLLKGDSSPRVGGSRSRYAFWRSPQVASRFWHPAQRLAMSNRSSFSSLSSTATSPSASSLSSIDSAFSFCSDSVSSPNEPSSLPFLFGMSARLRPLTPDTPKKFPKDWSMTFPVAVAQAPEVLDLYNKYDEGEEDKEHYRSISIQNREDYQLRTQSLCSLKGENRQSPVSQPDDSENFISDWSGEQVHQSQKDKVFETSESKGQTKEISITHIQLIKTNNQAVNKEEVKGTKITFYTSNRMLMKKQSDQSVEECGVSLVSDTGTEHQGNEELLGQSVQVHIPQTVFYGQNTPLVLQSVSIRQSVNNKEKGAKTKTEIDCGEVVPEQLGGGCTPLSQTSSKTNAKTASTISHNTATTISHTIRIKLPATVRNTVREYFSSSDNKNGNSDAKSIEKKNL
ncbi:rho GTPase-activating protein 20-like isoform X1 [Salvelinus sp. IW2-2015]|uniref:rho GTPase-activating protein 20-like isoform X1 n=1 Tax=Salvelinus sp. IW2-2015 TaxID=2691554 RepID=UPI000CDFC0C2|nr:rho GTPase-activating protein 20-like isoform X1 [Salvelinus alpinus]